MNVKPRKATHDWWGQQHEDKHQIGTYVRIAVIVPWASEWSYGFGTVVNQVTYKGEHHYRVMFVDERGSQVLLDTFCYQIEPIYGCPHEELAKEVSHYLASVGPMRFAI